MQGQKQEIPTIGIVIFTTMVSLVVLAVIGWIVFTALFVPPHLQGNRWEFVEIQNHNTHVTIPQLAQGSVWHFHRNGQLIVDGELFGHWELISTSCDWWYRSRITWFYLETENWGRNRHSLSYRSGFADMWHVFLTDNEFRSRLAFKLL